MRTTSSLGVACLASFVSFVHCSSSDTPAPTGDGGNAMQSGSSSGASGSSSSGGATTMATIADVTPDQAIAPVAIAVMANGHLVMPEGLMSKRVVEMDLTGHVVAVNMTDFTGLDSPTGVAVDDAGHILIASYGTIYKYDSSITGARSTYFVKPGNRPLDQIAYGGMPKRLYAITGDSPTAPTKRVVRFDAATATAAGDPIKVGDIASGAYQQMYVSPTNDVFIVESNGCRIVKMDATGTVTVVVGPALTATGSCQNGGGLGVIPDIIGQGRGVGTDPAGTRILFSEGARHALIDVTPDATGKSRALTVVGTFPDAVNNEFFATTTDAMYVVDSGGKKVKKVTF